MDAKTIWTVVWTGLITAVIFTFVENKWGPLLAGNAGPVSPSVVPSLAQGQPELGNSLGTPVVQAAQPITEAAFNVQPTDITAAFGTDDPNFYNGTEVIQYQ